MSVLAQQMKKRNFIVHPHKFSLWLFMLTMIMVFGGLTSAFIVSKSYVPEAEQMLFKLPKILITNTLVLVLSSVMIQFGVWAAKRGDDVKAMLGLVASLVLGVIFLFGQLFAWEDMTLGGLPFVDQSRRDNSVSFFYVFTFLHGLHIIAGLITFFVMTIKVWIGRYDEERKGLSFELIATFWHFLGALWLYLYVFLIVTQN